MEKNHWTAIISSTTMRTLSTPLMIYCKSYLAVSIGTNLANDVIRYSFSFSTRMDEGEAESELERDLASFFYPILGILRGLLSAGFSEEDAEEIVISMLDFAPVELRKRTPIF